MIRAEEALRLPTAQLTEGELSKATAVLAQIEAGVRSGMSYRGVDMKISEPSANVIAHVNQLLKLAGWEPNWQMIVEQHRLNKALKEIVGWQLSLAPSDAAYALARKFDLS